MNRRTFVVPDLHGRYELARALLSEAGIVDADGARVDRGVRTVQLGDAANCVYRHRERDSRLLRKSRAWFDVQLVGNHEYPYFGGPKFSGFAWIPEVERAVRNRDWLPSLAVGETLVTHAGVHPDLGFATAEQADAELRAAWHAAPGHAFFSQIGPSRKGLTDFTARTFGLPLHGGVLWRDATEACDDRYDQVFGHTVNVDGPILAEHENGRWALNLDCGGHHDVHRIVGQWLDADGVRDGTVEVDILAAATA